MVHPKTVLAEIDQQFPQSLARLFELLRFPSIGTDPAHHGDCRKTAEWLAAQLTGLGFKAELRKTTGQPLVLGRYAPPKAAGLPHVLFYGHYDVQPADPLELWTSAPFAPEIRKGKDGKDAIFARGACDDKGQLMTFLEASRSWLKVHGSLPFRLTVMIEGDEESDPAHIDSFLKARAREFPADVAFICDTEMWDGRTPAINTRLRGCMGIEVSVIGPKIDLHSGLYGGPVQNPIKVLSRILASVHDAKGRITIPGFYDGVKPIPPKLRKQWESLKFPAKKFLGEVGLSVPAGEQGYSALEQMWARPTAEVNGIYGGYQGPGSKTVLPSEATAKLTFRLVEGQDPKKIRKAFKAFVKSRLPKDCKVRFDDSGGDSSGIAVPEGTPWVNAARKALKEEFGRDPVMMGAGYSIPVVESFKKHLKVDSVLVGFAKSDDNPHSPDEKYEVDSFRRGIRSWTRIIAQFATE
ncbi:M20/M25/M40 family metallo-hydrolase [Aestuariivirga sp.]|uniref:M20/M25/M40 family metallo-hydrolase n=1 Tax=Aestuariivirga sp. TaxID=2650926 RepID=UPI003BAA3835